MCTIIIVRILSIDWGEKRIGLALSEGSFAEPYGVVSSFEELHQVVKKEGVDQVLLGLPEGKHEKQVRELSKRIKKELKIPVRLRSEVLTTQQALEKAIESGKSKKARRTLDALSAATLLQEYLDERERVRRPPRTT